MLNTVACQFWKDGSTFLTVSRYCSCQINADTLFLYVIVCSIEYNFVRDSRNQPLCSLVQNNFHYQSTLKTLILSHRTKNWQGYFPKKPTFYGIPMFVNIINLIPITNQIPWKWTAIPPSQIRKPIFQAESRKCVRPKWFKNLFTYG